MTRLTMTLIIPLMACGPLTQSCSEPESNSGSETVQLTIGHRSEWRELWLEGETNLPNGAYVNYRVTHDLARTGDSISQLLVVEYGLRSKNEEANGKVTGWAPAP